MSRAIEELELRKQLLVTRASVQRLRVAQHMGVLREELRLPALARSIVHSRQGRGVALALAMMVLGRSRWARAARVASVVLGVAGAVRAWSREKKDTGGAPPPGTA
jgi:hypothetical protein